VGRVAGNLIAHVGNPTDAGLCDLFEGGATTTGSEK
jgi:hypothetical protein